MTKEIAAILANIQNHALFEKHKIYFMGGTALSTYLDHRISYDIDFIATAKLPVSAINSFAFSLGANPVQDRAKASAFHINKGEELAHYHLRYMLNGVKMEFSYFDDAMIDVVLTDAIYVDYSEGSHLKKLSLDDIIKLKAIALCKRQKSRDLFDMAIVLEKGLLPLEELERIYTYSKVGEESLQEYIESFNRNKEDEGDSSLDFLPHHTHYKTFAKLSQDERFYKCKEMFLNQHTQKQKEKLEGKQRVIRIGLKKSR